MWFVGMLSGFLIGSSTGHFGWSVVLGIAGAFGFHFWFRKKKAEVAPEELWEPPSPAQQETDTAGDELFPGERQLLARVTALEKRVKDLEQQANSVRTADAPQTATTASAQAVPPTPTSAPLTSAVPLVSAPLRVQPPAVSTVTVSERLQEEKPVAPQPAPPVIDRPVAASLAVAEVAPPAAIPQPKPHPPQPQSQPQPKPQPAPIPVIPLRDRLPAPIASLIYGGNMLVKLGVLILFFGLAFLLRYTAERVTVPLELRYAMVALIGLGLLAAGWLLRSKRASYALVLQGAGIGVFYLTVLSAMKVHALLPTTAGFVFLFGVAVLSAALAVLQNAPVLAIVAALEGFAAPVLASSGHNQPVGLFTYLLVLDVGIVLIAWFKAWRVLNLIGFVGTFTLAIGWAEKYYTEPQYGIVQPFLVVFFVLFVAVGLLVARRTLFDSPVAPDASLGERALSTFKRVGRVDSSLVFGTPMVAYGLQYMLMRPWEYGAAFSAMGLAAFYLLLARVVFSSQPKGLALLAEAYAIVGVIFGTLAIPLAFEGQWTGAAWAVEAAGMYWLGARQARPYARAFSLLVFGGAVFKLLQATSLDASPHSPLLHGTVIGPLLVAAGALVMWGVYLATQEAPAQSEADGDPKTQSPAHAWEFLACSALPWLGMGALTLLLWQLFLPLWAAVATAALASLTFAFATRAGLVPLATVSFGLQALAVAGFIATLQRGGSTGAALGNGWQGALAASVIALSVLSSVGWTMLSAHRAALARGVPPQWSLGNQVAVVTGVSLLHLAMLFQMSFQLAALVWPLTAMVVFWVSLRFAHSALSAWAVLLHVISAALFLLKTGFDHQGGVAHFAHLGFWTPIALGLTALRAGDWLRGEAQRVGSEEKSTRWVNAWCAHSAALWLPVLVGLGWWLFAMEVEMLRALYQRYGSRELYTAASMGLVLLTSVLASAVAQRREWLQMGQATLGTLPLLLGIALMAIATAGGAHAYVPSAAWGWLAWPLAALWHLRLLKAQIGLAQPPLLNALHVGGFWFFLLLATRECQLRMDQWGGDGSAWHLLGWVIVPIAALWALQSRWLSLRWPVLAYAKAYREVAALPLAAFLLLWAWLSNATSAGHAAPLPYVPLLNPLELGQWMVLFVVLLWWRVLPGQRFSAGTAKGVAGITAFALVTGMVLRTCRHYAGVPWTASALYDSRLTQAALSLTWALCGVAAMVLGYRKMVRGVWVMGAALLGIVVLKLFFVELADRGGLFRIVSFMGVGALLLLVGYFAPVPPSAKEEAGDTLPLDTKDAQ